MTPLTTAFERATGLPVQRPEWAEKKTSISRGLWANRPEVLLSLHDDFEPLKEVWQKLEREGDATPFQSHVWLSAWQRHIGTNRRVNPAIVVGWDSEGGALFILPLGIERGMVLNKLIWLGDGLCDYQGPLLARGFSRQVSADQFPGLWQNIREMLPLHQIVTLERMPERIGGQANPFMALGNMRRHASSAHLTMLQEDWESYYAEKRSSGSKKRDRQKRRKIEELGDVRFVTPACAEERLSALETLVAQKSVAFARMGVANIFDKPGHLDFYRALASDTEAASLFHLSHLSVGSSTAAVSCGLSMGGSYFYVLASYDEEAEVARFGPGVVHLMELMAHATGTGHRVFDFTIGDEAYKENWCEVEVPLFDYFEPNTLAGWTSVGPRIAFLQAKRFIKQTPVLWQGFTRLRAAIGSFSPVRSAGA
ncbi:GNAT family N-acetyltransferase [Parvibaculum sp.]|uniref:GNAT family N-acetyltransferase n=1 Tax=Parvibaculum sp. TaxID=2024848 RepID=UPI003919A198